MTKEIIFFLTHKYNNQISKSIDKIYKEKGTRDFHVLVHGDLEIQDAPCSIHTFSLKQLQSLKFEMINNSIVPGSTHLPLMYHFREFPGYDYYWFIEYDVEFGGNWSALFDTYRECEADFITSYITHYKREEKWPWWHMEHPHKSISKSDRVRSFNPICRISGKALQFLTEELSTGWKGHFEVMIPTLLYRNNFQLLDFSGSDEFCSSSYPDFYSSNFQFSNKLTRYFKLGSMRYRPAMKKPGFRTLLYHPVKRDRGMTRLQETIYRVHQIGERIKKKFKSTG